MRLLILLLLAIGWLLSGYLLLRHFELTQTPAGDVSAGVCEAVAGADCDEALRSPLAIWWGLPLAGWGLAFYSVLAVLATTAAMFGRPVAGTLDRVGCAIATAGGLGSLGLLVAMGIGAAPLCPLCCGIHLVNLVLLAVWFRLVRAETHDKQAEDAVGEWNAPLIDLQWILGLKMLGLLAASLAGMVTTLAVLLLTAWFPASHDDPQAALAAFAVMPRWEIPIDSRDPRVGPESAPVQIVVFSDFQCASCRRVARDLGRLREENGEQVSLVFKHYPLGSDCNPQVRTDVHPQACAAARLAEATRMQQQFWDFHDMVFEGIGLVGISPDRVAQQIGVDKARLEADMQSTEVAARIQADIELGTRLGVDETPAVFIGGRRAPSVAPETLRRLVQAERASAVRKVVPQGNLGQPAVESSGEPPAAERP